MLINGHVTDLRNATGANVIMTVALDTEHCNGQRLEIKIPRVSASEYLPGTAVEIHVAPSREGERS